MKEIKLNLENLSKEEREQLMSLVEKANKPKTGRWKPKHGELYYVGATHGVAVPDTWMGTKDDENRHKIGNVFKTEEEAKFALEKRKVEVELQDIADELNEGWEPDWNNKSECKHYILYDYIDKRFNFNFNTVCKCAHVYFKSERCAIEAIKRIGGERLKKYYFEVE